MNRVHVLVCFLVACSIGCLIGTDDAHAQFDGPVPGPNASAAVVMPSVPGATSSSRWQGQTVHSHGHASGRVHHSDPAFAERSPISVMGFGAYSPRYRYSRFDNFHPYGFNPNAYDPYVTGSFRAPDLLDDPYFRARHRYDSHFPGRRQSQPRKSSPRFLRWLSR